MIMMSLTVAEVTEILDELAPARLAEPWDNSGLQVGCNDWPVKKIRVSLDPLPEVVSAACAQQVDLLITHHPLLFKPLHSIDFSTPVGRIILLSARHSLAVYSAHTNLDSVSGGINDQLASRIGLNEVTVLGEEIVPGKGEGLGRVGRLIDETTLADLVSQVKTRLNLDRVKWSGDPGLSVRRVAVCSGSGGGMMKPFFASGAQVFITGDLRYHDGREAEARGRGLIDIGHFGSEHWMTEVLAARIEKVLIGRGVSVTVEACKLERDPFHFS